MGNVIRLTRIEPDPKFGLTPDQWIADAIETLLAVCEQWVDEADPATIDHDSPEQKRRTSVGQVLINLIELHERMTMPRA